jgi:hypothetical protein
LGDELEQETDASYLDVELPNVSTAEPQKEETEKMADNIKL